MFNIFLSRFDKFNWFIFMLLLIVRTQIFYAFDPTFYINKYSDVPRNDIAAFYHYINHGFYENRVCAASFENTNFDWQYYVKTNNLNISTENEAKDHYDDIGKIENLQYCKEFKIGILLHLYSLDLMNEFIDKINHFIKINMLNDFYIKINIPIGDNINKHLDLSKDLEFDQERFNHILNQTPYHKNLINNKNYQILYDISNKLEYSFDISKNRIQIIFSENRGADIGGTFLLFDQIFKEALHLDYIVKLHTKTHYPWRQVLTSILKLKVNKLFNYYEYIDTCHIPAESSIPDLHFVNNRLLKYFNLPYYKYFGFSAGTMFITSMKMINFFKSYDLLALFHELNLGNYFHSVPGIKLEHAYERFFGYIANYLELEQKIIGYIK